MPSLLRRSKHFVLVSRCAFAQSYQILTRQKESILAHRIIIYLVGFLSFFLNTESLQKFSAHLSLCKSQFHVLKVGWLINIPKIVSLNSQQTTNWTKLTTYWIDVILKSCSLSRTFAFLNFLVPWVFERADVDCVKISLLCDLSKSYEGTPKLQKNLVNRFFW